MPVSTNAIDRVGLFFESYTRALENFDTKHMTQHFMLPAMMLSDDNCTVFPEASKLEGLFNQGIGFYRQYGIVHARPEIWSKKMLSSRIVKVKVNWQYFDADNHPAYNCDDHYILKLDKQNEWKIQVMVSVNEKERMSAWLEGKKAIEETE
ncbi:hypothetical protein ACTHGU_05900 [Chitinophagaceae bacterium MMS25-I14]